jgi:hypothetical protein
MKNAAIAFRRANEGSLTPLDKLTTLVNVFVYAGTRSTRWMFNPA